MEREGAEGTRTKDTAYLQGLRPVQRRECLTMRQRLANLQETGHFKCLTETANYTPEDDYEAAVVVAAAAIH